MEHQWSDTDKENIKYIKQLVPATLRPPQITLVYASNRNGTSEIRGRRQTA